MNRVIHEKQLLPFCIYSVVVITHKFGPKQLLYSNWKFKFSVYFGKNPLIMISENCILEWTLESTKSYETNILKSKV